MTETLEALKITRGILLKSIVDLETQIAEIEKPEPQKWEPKGGSWWIAGDGKIGNIKSMSPGHVVERETKEQAEKAAIEMRRFNRLLAYRDEFAPGYEHIFGNRNCYVYYSDDRKEWYYSVNTDVKAITVYMPEQVAQGLCEKLNSGEVVL